MDDPLSIEHELRESSGKRSAELIRTRNGTGRLGGVPTEIRNSPGPSTELGDDSEAREVE
jgi:hypothetical protein